MGKVLFFIHPFIGHIKPTMPLVEMLLSKGEKIIYYSLDMFKDKIESAGIIYKKYKNYGNMFNWGCEERCLTFRQGYQNLIKVYGRNFSPDFEKLKMEVGLEIEKEKPDYIIYDYFDAYWAKKAADEIRIPAIASVPTFAVCEELLSVSPEECFSFIFRLPPEEAFTAGKKDGARNLVRILTRQICQLFSVPEFSLLEYGNSNIMNIVHTSKYFQPYSEVFNDNFVFAGYHFEGLSGDAFGDNAFQEELSAKTVIYISLGTTSINYSQGFYKSCIEAFENSDRLVLMSVGNKTDINNLGNIPTNFIVRNSFPQDKILKYVNVFITHGGMNSVQEACNYCVPLLVIPGQGDQFAVANRIRQLGAGLVIEGEVPGPGDIRGATEALLRNNNFSKNSKEIGDSLKNSMELDKITDKLFQIIY